MGLDDIMGWTIGQIFGGAAGIIVLLSVLIEITPIKINPISRFLGWIGSKTNRNIMEKFDALNSRVDTLESELGTMSTELRESRAITARVRILRFGDEIRIGQKHSKEGYDQVLSDIDYYEQYCDANPNFKNNKTVTTTEKIKSSYSDRIDKNDFL